MTDNADKATKKLILWVGFFLGVMLSWGLLSGDSQGRVNILHLMAVYVFLPIISLMISTASLAIGSGFNLAKLVSRVPFWGAEQKRELLKLNHAANTKLVFYYQSQLAAISFSFASIFVLLILLLTTDVNFVWRSTLLSAENIYPLLQFLALPWSFWESAQPDLSLLIATQDSRVGDSHSMGSRLGGWWQYILAVQLCYALLLRVIALMICKLLINVQNKKKASVELVTERRSSLSGEQSISLASVASDTASDYALNNWAGLDNQLITEISKSLTHKRTGDLKAGPLASYAEQLVAERWQEPQLLIVKGWEPPLGELKDFMQNGSGYLLPVDWKENQLCPLSESHFDEWRRFVSSLPKWQIIQLEL